MKRVLVALFLIAILIGAILYNIHARAVPPIASLPPPGSTGSEASPVTVSTARRRAMRQTLSLVGILRTDRQAAVSAKIPCRIAAVLVREGDRVHIGQPLIRLEVNDSKAQVTGAEAGVSAAKAQYQKAVEGKRARKQEMEAQIAQAQGALRTALVRRRQAELAVELTTRNAASDAERADAAVKQAEAGLRQAETGLSQAKEALKRLQFLYDHGGIPKVDLESVQSQAAIAQAQRDSAVAALDQARAAARPATDTIPLRKKVSEADVSAAKTGVQEAEVGLRNAYRGLGEAMRLADRDIDAAHAQILQALAARNQAITQVGDGVLTSPIAGVVSGVAVHTGDTAQPGKPLMNIVATTSTYLEGAAPARYASAIRPGQPARVTVDTIPNDPLDGEVTEVLPLVNADNRSVSVRIHLQAGGLHIAPGAMAKALVELAQDKNAISIPMDALRTEGSISYVYIVVDGHVQRRNLSLGAIEGQFVQVLSGLASGDSVVVTGPDTLQSGMPVQIVGH